MKIKPIGYVTNPMNTTIRLSHCAAGQNTIGYVMLCYVMRNTIGYCVTNPTIPSVRLSRCAAGKKSPAPNFLQKATNNLKKITIFLSAISSL